MISLVDLQPASQTRPDLVEVLPYTGFVAPATRRPHILLPMNNPCQDFSKTGEHISGDKVAVSNKLYK